jgi:hypothetical protein
MIPEKYRKFKEFNKDSYEGLLFHLNKLYFYIATLLRTDIRIENLIYSLK